VVDVACAVLLRPASEEIVESHPCAEPAIDLPPHEDVSAAVTLPADLAEGEYAYEASYYGRVLVGSHNQYARTRTFQVRP
jgi:hypothetical protein